MFYSITFNWITLHNLGLFKLPALLNVHYPVLLVAFHTVNFGVLLQQYWNYNLNILYCILPLFCKNEWKKWETKSTYFIDKKHLVWWSWCLFGAFYSRSRVFELRWTPSGLNYVGKVRNVYKMLKLSFRGVFSLKYWKELRFV